MDVGTDLSKLLGGLTEPHTVFQGQVEHNLLEDSLRHSGNVVQFTFCQPDQIVERVATSQSQDLSCKQWCDLLNSRVIGSKS